MWQRTDYVVLRPDSKEVGQIIEVKEVHINEKRKRYYPNQKEKRNIRRMLKFCDKRQIPFYLWIYYIKGRGKKRTKDIWDKADIIYDIFDGKY